MNELDASILAFINQFSRGSWAFDAVVRSLARSDLLKGGVTIALVWWAWFREQEQQAETRGRILLTLASSVLAVLAARILAAALPFRTRPLHEEGLSFVVPYTMDAGALERWSSFPSDHATLFCCLATGLWSVHRKAGWAALAYALVAILFPRLYLGLHYPSDLIAGALLGAGATAIAIGTLRDHRLVRLLVERSHSAPALFYPLFFLLTYQVADLFVGARDLAELALRLLRTVVS